ncbi:hypothetical protein E4U48_006168 [Claviceps purpurea]|nr:hypothetical protein E4U48_006168 [Claviceps purpurea]
MATSILRRTCKPLANRLAWKPLAFPSEGFAVIPADERIEEETLPNYATSQYYPVAIGEIFRARYQVVGKLGFGTTSTAAPPSARCLTHSTSTVLMGVISPRAAEKANQVKSMVRFDRLRVISSEV